MSHEMEILALQASASSPGAKNPLPCPLPEYKERELVVSPRVPIAIRVARMDDLPFMDRLQKKHHKQLGFFPRAQMEGYIRNGWVLVAEASGQCSVVGLRRAQSSRGQQEGSVAPSLLTTDHRQPTTTPIGYVAYRDRYLKRDELGAIFQLCVDDCAQRKLVGAMLLKEAFERSPYGCKLFCCWCAQDIQANYFWEAMGFVPLAFRAGSAKKARVHIFWQKRIRARDNETPYWFPSQTNGGAISEDRIVLPIPPGMRWDDEMPRILPEARLEISDQKSEVREKKPRKPSLTSDLRPPFESEPQGRRLASITTGGLRFGAPNRDEPATKAKRACPEQGRREKKPKAKNDPRLVAAARELRDRWMEEVTSGKYLPQAQGKYDVCRVLAEASGQARIQIAGKLPALPAPDSTDSTSSRQAGSSQAQAA